MRAPATYYLAEAYARTDRSLPADSEAALVACATGDPAFAPRFQARMALDRLARPIPLDPPATVYTLKVRLRRDRATRILALHAQHTLADLHYAIQRAFKWDADHLYSFYMTGDRRNALYEIACPELDSTNQLETTSVTLAALGLVPKHSFVYFFDFGDGHSFELTVLSIAAQPDLQADAAPRLLEAKGQAPRQYHWGEEEDEA